MNPKSARSSAHRKNSGISVPRWRASKGEEKGESVLTAWKGDDEAVSHPPTPLCLPQLSKIVHAPLLSMNALMFFNVCWASSSSVKAWIALDSLTSSRADERACSAWDGAAEAARTWKEEGIPSVAAGGRKAARGVRRSD